VRSRATLRAVNNVMPHRGPDLQAHRIVAGVRVTDLAKAMGVVPSRISAIERAAAVRPDTAIRYLKALVTCGTRGTSAEAA